MKSFFLLESPDGNIFILIIGVLIYFVPTFIAYNKKKRNRVAILLVNLFAGWVFGIGWIVALVWAASYEKPLDPETREVY